MPPLPNIFAQVESDDIGKIIFGIIALIFWAVGAMASSAKKQREAQRRRELLEADRFEPPPQRSPPPPIVRPAPPMMQPNVPQPPPVRPVPPLPPRVAPAPPRLQAPQVPRVMTPAPPQRRKQLPKKQPRRVAPVPPRIPMPVPARAQADEDAASTPSVLASEIRSAEETKAAAAAARKPAVTATTLSRWLTPGTLRSQFILTEVLQPPLAMRPDREQQTP